MLLEIDGATVYYAKSLAIGRINRTGVTVLPVEQNVHLAPGVAQAACALRVGRVVLEGDIETMKSSEIVRRAYLGG